MLAGIAALALIAIALPAAYRAPYALSLFPVLVLVSVLQDKAGRRRDADRRRESRARQKAILDASFDPILCFDTEGTIQEVSASVEKILGWRQDALTGTNIRVLLPDLCCADKDISQCLLVGKRRESEAMHRDGWRIPCEISVSEVAFENCVDCDAEESPLFAGTVRDISEQKAQQIAINEYADHLEAVNVELEASADALDRANAELELSNKELDDFAYIASHDLKEPLRGIHNYATFLLEDYGDRLDEDGLQKLETLPRLTQRLEDLINALLQFSRLGRVDFAVAETDLDVVLDGVLDTLHISLEERGVEVRRPVPLPMMVCDSARVAEVFRNLVTNALKYNESDQKWIEIGVRGDEGVGETVFFVADNGIGIREKHKDSVFRIFKRLHSREKYSGTGAGLTIVKKIVEKHNGKIWVESEFGEGTTFLFTLGGRARPHEHVDTEQGSTHLIG